MRALLRKLSQQVDFHSIVQSIKEGLDEQMVTGLMGSARSAFLAALYKETKAPFFVVTHSMLQAHKVYDDLQEWLPPDEIALFPATEALSAEWLGAAREEEMARLKVLQGLLSRQVKFVVVPISGWRRLLPSPAILQESSFSLRVGEEFSLNEMVSRLNAMGFVRVERVEKVGEYSQRGGLVDFFPTAANGPLRVEWFDDEVDSIRRYELETQRSIENLQHLWVFPLREWILPEAEKERVVKGIRDMLQEQLARTRDGQLKERLQSHVEEELERVENDLPFPGRYKYLHLLYPGHYNLLNFMPPETVVVFDEALRILDAEKQLVKEEGEVITRMLQEGKFLPQAKTAFSWEELQRSVLRPTIYLSLFLRQIPHTRPQNVVHYTAKPLQVFHGQLNILKSEVERWKKHHFHVVFVAANEERCRYLQRVLADYKIETDLVERDSEELPLRPVIIPSGLQAGFELPTLRLAVVTEEEVFVQRQRKVKGQRQLPNAERIKHYQELKPGDHVVHVNHGIGKFVCMETLLINGVHRDYLHIRYAGNDKLYVPVEQIDLVQKYSGGDEGREPKVNSLSGSEWQRVKSKVRSSVADIAADLVKLYAQRVATPGYAFSPDTPYQQEFESLFAYEETPDQLRSIQEVKRDMENAHPMDRLLCGDVGYGKTEVAIRAAFKAVMDGKQVAFLVPTTILAQQHFETLKERFANYPVRIDVLSRFRSRKEQTETIQRLTEGVVDIVIGTHRLLSKDVSFKDLGLLIVDEEQRFGVSHKEKIKRLRANVDVLTLTATPIPRTLHMSLLGVRDLSVIETPPENRYPVQTFVLEYSPALVREAMERELARGGQIYFLHNTVHNIQLVAEELSFLVPQARIAVAHGQMPEAELERTIFSFLEGDYDILVSTTIIETGVDIPNVNTLIVTNSDRMGLSQLYQLRGRVGRSNRVAYAYFTHQPNKVLSEIAEKRLEAIKEFTELGSGFKIAMRDLSIRGAGNLLGPEQHGFIASVGFDLYNQMLEEAIRAFKEGKPPEEVPRASIDLHVDAFIPDTYIPDSGQKIEMYKRFAVASSEEMVGDLHDELLDRFGDLPPAVERLMRVCRLRILAQRHGVESVKEQSNEWHIHFWPEVSRNINGMALLKLVQPFPNDVRLLSGEQVGLVFPLKNMAKEDALLQLQKLFMELDQIFRSEPTAAKRDNLSVLNA